LRRGNFAEGFQVVGGFNAGESPKKYQQGENYFFHQALVHWSHELNAAIGKKKSINRKSIPDPAAFAVQKKRDALR
jgi:hypothetical protein